MCWLEKFLKMALYPKKVSSITRFLNTKQHRARSLARLLLFVLDQSEEEHSLKRRDISASAGHLDSAGPTKGHDSIHSFTPT